MRSHFWWQEASQALQMFSGVRTQRREYALKPDSMGQVTWGISETDWVVEMQRLTLSSGMYHPSSLWVSCVVPHPSWASLGMGVRQ